jgi:hypothetical protein
MYQLNMSHFDNNLSLILNEKKFVFILIFLFLIKLKTHDKKEKDMFFY